MHPKFVRGYGGQVRWLSVPIMAIGPAGRSSPCIRRYQIAAMRRRAGGNLASGPDYLLFTKCYAYNSAIDHGSAPDLSISKLVTN